MEYLGKTWLQLVAKHGVEKAKSLVKSGDVIGMSPRNRKERRTLESVIRKANKHVNKRKS